MVIVAKQTFLQIRRPCHGCPCSKIPTISGFWKLPFKDGPSNTRQHQRNPNQAFQLGISQRMWRLSGKLSSTTQETESHASALGKGHQRNF